jgi:hypothetical protein
MHLQGETLRNVGIVYQPILVVSNYYVGATAILLPFTGDELL